MKQAAQSVGFGGFGSQSYPLEERRSVSGGFDLPPHPELQSAGPIESAPEHKRTVPGQYPQTPPLNIQERRLTKPLTINSAPYIPAPPEQLALLKPLQQVPERSVPIISAHNTVVQEQPVPINSALYPSGAPYPSGVPSYHTNQPSPLQQQFPQGPIANNPGQYSPPPSSAPTLVAQELPLHRQNSHRPPAEEACYREDSDMFPNSSFPWPARYNGLVLMVLLLLLIFAGSFTAGWYACKHAKCG